MTKCPKCSGRRIAGPNYDSDREALTFKCVTCGFSRSEPTHDSADHRRLVERQLSPDAASGSQDK